MMSTKVRTELTDKLFKYILSLETVDECYQLFEDLCTVNEIKSIAQRMAVAEMLDKKWTYIEIAEKTGASTATISRVNRALSYGNDGYKMVIDRLSEKEAEADSK